MRLENNSNQKNSENHLNLAELAQQIKIWGQELGFQQVGITDTNLSHYADDLSQWLKKGFQGNMEYMLKHGEKRTHPQNLIPGTTSIIMVRMNYLPHDPDPLLPKKRKQVHSGLSDPTLVNIARYARGQDYHKFMRKRLLKLAQKIENHIGPFSYRPFVDSGPVMEKPLAEKAGLGWIGKNTLLINQNAGSFFFLGALFTNLQLPQDPPEKNLCGSCSACIDICPTKAIVGPKQLDARKCIAYLTIENKGPIPIEFRSQIGNRIFGCDDCQEVCPWNKYAQKTSEAAFYERMSLQARHLISFFTLTESEYSKLTEGSALKRSGYQGWLRNCAIALGNAPFDEEIVKVLKAKLSEVEGFLAEHIQWAIDQQSKKFVK